MNAVSIRGCRTDAEKLRHGRGLAEVKGQVQKKFDKRCVLTMKAKP